MFSKILGTLVLATCLLIGVFIYGPYGATISLTQALENEDTKAVAKQVDFDALRTSLNDDFAKKLGIAPKESLGSAIVGRIAGAFLSQIISADSMVMALKDKERREHLGLSADLTNIIIHSQWIDMDTFVLNNLDGAPATLLKRDGLNWRVAAMRIN